jgi:DNA-directed RNA polymerase specialized sigma subunit
MANRQNTATQPILKLLKQANRIEKNVLCLYYFEKLSVSEIAVALKKDKRVVQKVMEKILTKMSSQISKANAFSGKTSRL